MKDSYYSPSDVHNGTHEDSLLKQMPPFLSFLFFLLTILS